MPYPNLSPVPGRRQPVAAALTRGGALLLALLLAPPPAAAQDTTAVRTAKVTYIAGSSIYIGAGRDDGLAEGQELSLVRGDSVAAVLVVRYLSSHQASCELQRGAVEVALGETVRYTARAAAAVPVVAAAPARRSHRLGGPGLHGRVGGRYLVGRTDGAGSGFSQPSLDLRLDGTALGGTGLGLVADLRTRRTTTTRSDGSSEVDGRTRVYQAALRWSAPGTAFRATVGRQYLTQVTSVSLFDGALVELAGPRVTAGAFGGVEPEPASLGFSRETQDFGGYVELHARPASHGHWSLSAGAVGSYQSGKANREFAFLQAGVSTPGVSLYALQELDYYRPWKVQQGESSLSPTSTYLSGSLRPARWLALNGSYDNRRSVRLYRDAVDPATAFDDAYRKGVSGGFTLIGRRVRLGGDLRLADGGPGGRATAWTATGGIDRFTPLHLSLTGRATWYHNPTLDGRIYGARVGADPFGTVHLELQGGIRNEDDPLADPSSRHITWYGADLDVALARAWFASGSVERERGGDVNTTQLYLGLSWRF